MNIKCAYLAHTSLTKISRMHKSLLVTEYSVLEEAEVTLRAALARQLGRVVTW